MITITPENAPETIPTSVVCVDSRFEIELFDGKSMATPVEVSVIPESFWNGIADCDSGRVVDMEVALNESPPIQD